MSRDQNPSICQPAAPGQRKQYSRHPARVREERRLPCAGAWRHRYTERPARGRPITVIQRISRRDGNLLSNPRDPTHFMVSSHKLDLVVNVKALPLCSHYDTILAVTTLSHRNKGGPLFPGAITGFQTRLTYLGPLEMFQGYSLAAFLGSLDGRLTKNKREKDKDQVSGRLRIFYYQTPALDHIMQVCTRESRGTSCKDA